MKFCKQFSVIFLLLHVFSDFVAAEEKCINNLVERYLIQELQVHEGPIKGKIQAKTSLLKFDSLGSMTWIEDTDLSLKWYAHHLNSTIRIELINFAKKNELNGLVHILENSDVFKDEVSVVNLGLSVVDVNKDEIPENSLSVDYLFIHFLISLVNSSLLLDSDSLSGEEASFRLRKMAELNNELLEIESKYFKGSNVLFDALLGIDHVETDSPSNVEEFSIFRASTNTNSTVQNFKYLSVYTEKTIQSGEYLIPLKDDFLWKVESADLRSGGVNVKRTKKVNVSNRFF